jgi:hypothetical protein
MLYCLGGPQDSLRVSDALSAGPKGQESIAQGLPWVSQKNVLALKGQDLEMRTLSVGSGFSPYRTAPSGLLPLGDQTQGEPWLSFLGHFGPRIAEVQTAEPYGTKNRMVLAGKGPQGFSPVFTPNPTQAGSLSPFGAILGFSRVFSRDKSLGRDEFSSSWPKSEMAI